MSLLKGLHRGSLIQLTDQAIKKYGVEYRDVFLKVNRIYSGKGENMSGLHPNYDSSVNIEGQPRLVLVECVDFPHLIYGFGSGVSEEVILANPNVEFKLTSIVSCVMDCTNKAVARLFLYQIDKPWKYSTPNLCADHLVERVSSLPSIPCENSDIINACVDCDCKSWTKLAFITETNELTPSLSLCHRHLTKRVKMFIETGNMEEASQKLRIPLHLYGKRIISSGADRGETRWTKSITSDIFDVDLSGETISHIDLRPLERHTNMTSIDLSNNFLSKLDLEPLKSCTKLHQLILHDNNLISITLEPLREYSILEEIDLSGNKLTQLDLSPLSQCRRLKRLDLSRNRLRYLDCTPVLILPNLEMLAIDLNTVIIISHEEFLDPDFEEKMTKVFRPHIPEYQRFVRFKTLEEKELYQQSRGEIKTIIEDEIPSKKITWQNATWQDLLDAIDKSFNPLSWEEYDELHGSHPSRIISIGYGSSDEWGFDNKMIYNMYPQKEFKQEPIYNEYTHNILVSWGTKPLYLQKRHDHPRYGIEIRRVLKDFTIQKQSFSIATRSRDTARACANFIQEWLMDLPLSSP